MGQRLEPAVSEQLFVLGLDRNGTPRGARFAVVKDSIVSAALDMNCRVLIRPPAEVSALASRLPLGHVLGTGKIVRLFIPRIEYDLYQEILEASRVAIIHEEASIAAAISTTVH